jgi:hypothetical protein
VECDDENCLAWDGCTWGLVSEFQVNQTWEGLQFSAEVATLTSGDFVVAWRALGTQGPSSKLVLRRFGTDGEALSGEADLGPGNAGYLQPSLAAQTTGGFVLTWVSQSSNLATEVAGQVFGPDGNPVGDELVVNQIKTGDPSGAKVGGVADGGFVVVWQSSTGDGSGGGIFARAFSGGGSPIGGDLLVNEFVVGDQVKPCVATQPGIALVVWESEYAEGSDGGTGIYGRFTNQNAEPLGGEFRVNELPQGNQISPRAAGLADGRFVVVFQDSGQFDNPMLMQFYSQEGDPVGNNTKLLKYALPASVAALPNGGFVVGGADHPWVLRVSAAGVVVGEKASASLLPADSPHTAVTALPDGGFAAVWSNKGLDGDDWGVFAQRFDSAGKKLVH